MSLNVFPWISPSTDAPSEGAQVTTRYSTQIAEAWSGREQRRRLWTIPKHEFTVAWNKTENAATRVDALWAFYQQQGGALLPFVFWSFDLNRTWAKVPIGTTTTAATYLLPAKGLTGAKTIYLDGTAANPQPTVTDGGQAYSQSLITFAGAQTAGKALTATWTGQRLFVCRFAEDSLTYEEFCAMTYSFSLKLVEVIGEYA